MTQLTDRQRGSRPPRRSWRDLPAAPPVADLVPQPDATAAAHAAPTTGTPTTGTPTTEIPTTGTPTTEIPIVQVSPPAGPATPPQGSEEAPARRPRRARWIVGASVAVVAVLAASVVAVRAADGDDGAPVTPTLPEGDPGSPAAVAAALGPAVVQIDLLGGEEAGGGVGSGVIYDDSGLVLTAHHVVSMADEVIVRTADERTFTGRVVGRAPERDLAVLALDDADDLTAARIAEAGTVEVGETAIALGSPFGFEQSVTAGIVSGLDRELESPAGSLTGLIQTDAPINPGNSGGPLADAGARVIGINTAIASMSGGNDGVGFAVPVDDAAALLAEVEANGGVDAPTVPAPDGATGVEIPGLDRIPGLDQVPGLREMLEELFGAGGGPFELDRLPDLDRIPGLDRLPDLDRIPGLDRLPDLDRIPGLDRLPDLQEMLEEMLGPLGGIPDDLSDLFGDEQSAAAPVETAAVAA